MNNRIKIDNFWKAGGICEIELYPDFRCLVNNDVLMFANSNDSLIEAEYKIFDMYLKLRTEFNINLKSYRQLIRNIRFLLNGISYSIDHTYYMIFDIPSCYLNEQYIIATGKYYRGATI